MKPAPWFLHPVAIFVISILALVASLFLTIYWYMEVSSGLEALVERFHLESGQVLAPESWVVVLVLSALVGIILLSLLTIFVYNQKTLQLYRLQRNFIDNFTHELKTPVTSLQLFLETFQKYDLTREERQKYLGLMLTDVGRLSDTISRILSLARLESRSYQAHFQPLDLVALVRDSLAQNAALFAQASIRIHPPPGGVCRQPVDRALFDMLVVNLLMNAIKHNESPRPEVDVRFASTPRHWLIHFEDNGVGIDRHEVRKIFRKFYQAGRTEGRWDRGSGLGLHLVQNIARIHRGRVSARGRENGQGSVLTVALPRWRVERPS
jgi:signal transduction histidine kinase